jgi:hypothetical protein
LDQEVRKLKSLGSPFPDKKDIHIGCRLNLNLQSCRRSKWQTVQSALDCHDSRSKCLPRLPGILQGIPSPAQLKLRGDLMAGAGAQAERAGDAARATIAFRSEPILPPAFAAIPKSAVQLLEDFPSGEDATGIRCHS